MHGTATNLVSEESELRKLLTISALALAMAAASPAFAQPFSNAWGTGNIARNVTPQNPDGIFRYPFTNHSTGRPVALERGGLGAFAYKPASGAISRDTNQPPCAGDLSCGRLDYGAC
jgi:hypothetical protein